MLHYYCCFVCGRGGSKSNLSIVYLMVWRVGVGLFSLCTYSPVHHIYEILWLKYVFRSITPFIIQLSLGQCNKIGFFFFLVPCLKLFDTRTKQKSLSYILNCRNLTQWINCRKPKRCEKLLDLIHTSKRRMGHAKTIRIR